MSSKTKQISAASEEVEIMPVDAINVSDYEQTNTKPPRVVQIEDYIKNCEESLLVLERRLHHLNSQRPDIIFKNNKLELASLEKSLTEVNKQKELTQDRITGAKNELKREVRRWIDIAGEAREAKRKDMENQLKEIESAVQKHLDAISELQQSKASLYPGDKFLTVRLKQELKFSYYTKARVSETICELMNMHELRY